MAPPRRKAYTAIELANFAQLSKQSCSNHLRKLLEQHILRVEKQGRHRYFALYDEKVANALEGIAILTRRYQDLPEERQQRTGIMLARTCYDHLAGHLGVALKEALLNEGRLTASDSEFACSERGLRFFADLGIAVPELKRRKRKFAYPCLDWSERKQHLGGALGASLLDHMLANDWLRRKEHSRELIITSKGRQQLLEKFKLEL